MARTRKSRPQAKTARTSGTRKTPPAGRKPAARAKSGRAPPPDPLDGFVEAAARVLALPLEPQWLPAIKANLAVNLRLAGFVAEFSLPDETEPAPIFTA
jgi:hypothetical protein